VGANGNSDYVLPADSIVADTAAPTGNQVLPVTINPADGKGVYLFTATEKLIETGAGDTNLKWGIPASLRTAFLL